MFEPDDQGISSWPAESQPFVRVTTDDGVLYGRAARWKGRLVCVDIPSSGLGKWDNYAIWVDISQCVREPGHLPEYAAACNGGNDDPDVLWHPDRCAWPREH